MTLRGLPFQLRFWKRGGKSRIDGIGLCFATTPHHEPSLFKPVTGLATTVALAAIGANPFDLFVSTSV
jgi:hypothetical protein